VILELANLEFKESTSQFGLIQLSELLRREEPLMSIDELGEETARVSEMQSARGLKAGQRGLFSAIVEPRKLTIFDVYGSE